MSEFVVDNRTAPRLGANRKAMIDSAVFAKKIEKIFNHSWLYLGHDTDCASPTIKSPGASAAGR